MARRVGPLKISFDEYRAIFCDSDKEGTEDIEGDSSDIEFSGIEENHEEANGESVNEGASDSDDEEEQPWKADLSNIVVDEFSARSRIVVDVGVNPKADDFFSFMFDEDLFEKIVEKTNYYARQKVADNEQRLGRWCDVCKPEVKAYFGMCVIMGMNILPMVADY